MSSFSKDIRLVAYKVFKLITLHYLTVMMPYVELREFIDAFVSVMDGEFFLAVEMKITKQKKTL